MADFRPVSPEELSTLQPLGAPVETSPGGFRKVSELELQTLIQDTAPAPPASDPSISEVLLTRLFGTDVDDPLEFQRLSSIIALSLAGGKAGFSLGTPAGPVGMAVGGALGSVAGAAAGAVLPERVLSGLELFGLEGAEEAGLDEDEQRRVATGEALLEAVTLGALGTARLATRAASRTLAGVTPEGQKLAAEAHEKGIDLPVASVGSRNFPALVLTVLGRFPLFGGFARKTIRRADELLQESLKRLPDRVAPLVAIAPENLGFKILDDANSLFDEVGKSFNRRYDKLFLEARRKGIMVAPIGLKKAADAAIQHISERQFVFRKITAPPNADEAVKAKRVAVPAAASSELTRRFIRANIDPILRSGKMMTLAQADEQLRKINQFIARVPRGIRKDVARMLTPLHAALQADIQKNLVGENAPQIASELAKLSAEFHEKMLTLFETATARRTIGRVQKGGLRDAELLPSKRATTLPVDKLADIALDLNSPQSVDELSRFVSKDTMRQIAANALGKVLRSAVTEVGGRTLMDPRKLREAFGVGISSSRKPEAWDRLLQGTGISHRDLTTLIEASDALAKTPLPNVSTFLARGAVIGSWRTVVNNTVPFLLVGGTSAVSSLFGGLMLLVGARGITRIVTDPSAALPLRVAISRDAKKVARKSAFLDLARLGISGLKNANEITADIAQELERGAMEYSNQLFGEREQ